MHSAYDPDNEVTEEMPVSLMMGYMLLDSIDDESLCGPLTLRCTLELDGDTLRCVGVE